MIAKARFIWLLSSLFVLLSVPVTFSSQVTSYAGAFVPENIRVALFIDIGKYYRGTVPSVTFIPSPRTPLSKTDNPQVDTKAVKSLIIGERVPGRVTPWITVTGDAPREFAPDSLMLALLETDSYSKANALLNKLTGTTIDKGYMDLVYRNGKPFFRVLTGMYVDRNATDLARNRLLGKSTIAPSVKADQIYVVGTKRLLVGTYTKENDANVQLTMLRQKGFQPAINYIADSKGVVTYVVSIGEAVTDADLESLRQAAVKSVPALEPIIKPLAWSTNSYLHMKEAIIKSGDSYIKSGLYLFNPSGQRVYIAPGTDGIRVEERENRSYRGNFEVTHYNGKLTVINELPFETYLCSVVGAEMGSLFSPEALKAQAILARTYAAAQGVKYKIANVSDTTYDQAYKGVDSERAKVTVAVLDTSDLVLTYQGKLISAVYFSNAGGLTAEPNEVWGGDRSYFKSVASPDEVAQAGLPVWYRVSLADGTIGYIHGDYVAFTGQANSVGLKELKVTGNTLNVRPMPSTSSSGNAPISTLKNGDLVTMIDSTPQSNSYRWIEGPYSANQVLQSMNAKANRPISGPLQTLEVVKRGASGRVMEVRANGKLVEVSVPDNYRSVMGGLRSTLFDIEQTGSYTVLGASGKKTTYPQPTASKPLAVLQAGQVVATTLKTNSFVAVDGSLQPRVMTKDVQFRFIGRGFGHGLGLSQWGAEGLARKGMNTEQILKYFYEGVSITKDSSVN